MNIKPTTYQTERLLLKPTSEADAEFIFELMNTPSWKHYIGDRNIKTVEDAKTYIIEKMLPQLNKLGFANYTLIIKDDNTKIGTCGLYDREGMEGFDIGFALLPDYEGKGFAYEAASKIKDLGFTQFDIDSISAFTTKDNYASQKLIEKLGLKLTGTTKLPNDEEELLAYKITKS